MVVRFTHLTGLPMEPLDQDHVVSYFSIESSSVSHTGARATSVPETDTR